MTTKKFKIINETVKSIDEDGVLYIEGIANTGQKDLVGDVVTENALQEIASQAVNRNLHLDHDTDLDGIIGVITEAEVVDEGVKIKARILQRFSDTIRELLSEGVRLGLSIAGKAYYEDNSFENIVNWNLTEISLTPIPCDQGTMGSVAIVKSFSELSQTICGEEKMAEEDVKYITEEAVVELINAAFNEKTEELLEVLRKEFEGKFDEIIGRLEVLENAEDTVEEEPEPVEPEAKPETQDEGEEEKAEGEGEGEQAKPEDEEDEEENTVEEEEKNIEEIIQKAVDEKIKDFFQTPTKTQFKYEEAESKSVKTEQKKYTPREIAKILIGEDL